MDASKVMIPDAGNTQIKAKAYLSRKDIKELIVPNSVDMIGDWAFAFMKNLEVLWLPAKEIRVGRDILKGCESLRDVMIYECAEKQDLDSTPESRLYAAVVTKMDTQSFLKPDMMGSRTWFQWLDQALVQLLSEDDKKGFSANWFGGEEDYLEDSTNNVEMYQKEKQLSKVTLLFLRLACADYLTEENKEIYYDYMRQHAIVDAQKPEHPVWRFLSLHTQELFYWSIFLEANCVECEDVPRYIEAIGEGNAELVSMFLTYVTKRRPDGDNPFANFVL